LGKAEIEDCLFRPSLSTDSPFGTLLAQKKWKSNQQIDLFEQAEEKNIPNPTEVFDDNNKR